MFINIWILYMHFVKHIFSPIVLYVYDLCKKKTRLLGTNFSEILIEIQTFSFKKTHLKMSSGKWGPFYLSLNVLI